MQMLLLVLFVLTHAAVPPDWQAKVNSGQMLYSANDLQVNPTIQTSVGNGFVSTVIGADAMYVAGVFNGFSDQAPSHRAAFPATLSVAAETTVIGSALALDTATFYRRSQLTEIQPPKTLCAPSKENVNDTLPDACARAGCHYQPDTEECVEGFILAQIEQRWYAHRTRYNLLIMEMTITNLATGNVSINFDYSSAFPSPDLNITVYPISASMVEWVGQIYTPELTNGQIVTFGLVTDRIPSTMTVAPGTTNYTFMTSIATSIESANPLSSAQSAYQSAKAINASALWSEHVSAWATIWQAGIDIDLSGGRLDVASTINSSLYYILSSIRPDRPYSLSPGSLSSDGYNGHTFWDCETWMWPTLLFLQPDIAKSALYYRSQRLQECVDKARSYDPPFPGGMVAWESAFTGTETCPTSANTGLREIHITSDVILAFMQYYYTTRDLAWLNSSFLYISTLADFWAGKSVYNGSDGYYHIHNVIPPDEYVDHVNDSVYTNAAASIALSFVYDAAVLLGIPPSPRWLEVANDMMVLYDSVNEFHPEYLGYPGNTVKQADVILLGYPLMWEMPEQARMNDLVFYAGVTDPSGPAMTWGMFSLGYLELGDYASAASYFNQSFANAQQPFLVWTETPTGGTTNFITGAGGFLQAVLFGYGGWRLHSDHINFNPNLIESTSWIRFRGVNYLGNTFNFAYNQQNITIELTAQTSTFTPLYVTQSSTGASQPLKMGSPVNIPVGPGTIATSS